MKTRTEKSILTDIRRVLESRGYVVIKIHGGPMQPVGVPDLLAMKDGRANWVEVKRPGGMTTKIQDHVAARLRGAGCTVIVARCVDDVKELV